MDKTFMMIKPDAVHRGYIGEVVKRIENKGLKIVAMKLVRLTKPKAEELYSPHRGKPFFSGLVEFITSGPLVALVIEGPQVIPQIRKMMGATNCAEADPGTIRGDLGVSLQNNLVHGSDSPESANREIPILFSKDELVAYERAGENVTFASEARV